MGSNMNFKGFMTDIHGGDGGGRPPGGNNALARQSSIYSLTFDELQSTMGGPGKDFGSMNMDELLKNIWSAEETQTMAPTGVVGSQDGFNQGQPPLQRQGSLTLPRTLSQKTVDEVWRNLYSKEGHGGAAGGSNVPQRQLTLGEMTLEEFLVRAGVVREDGPAVAAKVENNGGGFFGGFGNNGGFGFQQPDRASVGVMGSRASENGNLPLNANGVRSNSQQQSQQLQIFPKQQPVTYNTMGANSQLGSPGMRGGIMGIGEQGIGNALVQSPVLQGGGGIGIVGLGGGNGRVAAVSPASDGIGKSNGTDTSPVSPMPYVFSNGFRGRKGGPVEKVVERRQRRMIKNRESAARSRARKQMRFWEVTVMGSYKDPVCYKAYTMELEAEVAKLKEENQEMKKKQDEMMEVQKSQEEEIQNLQREGKRRRLRRTNTGPW